jgi:Alternative complex III, ActD subunit
MTDPENFGLLAEFETVDAVVSAARRTYEAGYRKIDAYSPFPIEELSEAIGFHRNGVAPIALVGGLLGCCGGFMLQWWINTINYPINVGGRPYNSWPAFIIVTFEMTILFGGLSAVAGMLMLNGLPQPHHPLFNVDRFSFVTRDRFFVLILSSDAKYDEVETRRFLESLRPSSISEVPI